MHFNPLMFSLELLPYGNLDFHMIDKSEVKFLSDGLREFTNIPFISKSNTCFIILNNIMTQLEA